MTLGELILEMKAAVKGSKENPSNALRDSKGFWKPAHQTLAPAIEHLEASERLVNALEAIASAHFGSEHPILKALNYELSEYRAHSEAPLMSLNEAKRALMKRKA